MLRAGDDLQESKTDRSGAFDIGPLSAGNYRVEAMTGGGDVLLLRHRDGQVPKAHGAAAACGQALASAQHRDL